MKIHGFIMVKSCLYLWSYLSLSVIVFYIARLAPGDPQLVSYYGERVREMTAGERAWAEEKLVFMNPSLYSMANGWGGQYVEILAFTNGCAGRSKAESTLLLMEGFVLILCWQFAS